MKHLQKWFLMVVPVFLFAVVFSSCSKDDPEPQNGLVGKWKCSELLDSGVSIEMVLIFNSDNTGSIEEKWSTRSSSSYKMDFNWSTTINSEGESLLKVSYVSGDKNTEIFFGGNATVLWTREYILTGNILNVRGSSGVWVFNRQ